MQTQSAILIVLVSLALIGAILAAELSDVFQCNSTWNCNFDFLSPFIYSQQPVFIYITIAARIDTWASSNRIRKVEARSKSKIKSFVCGLLIKWRFLLVKINLGRKMVSALLYLFHLQINFFVLPDVPNWPQGKLNTFEFIKNFNSSQFIFF